jgi:hypothetical protein
MAREKHENYNSSVLICNQLTEAETVKGRNGRPLFSEWSRVPEEFSDESKGEISRSYRVRGD